VLLALLLAGCSVTEVVLVIDSDLRIPDQLDEVRIEVDGSARALDVRVPMATTSELPLTHALVPADGRESFAVTVTGLSGGNPVVADRRESGWVDGESRLLELWLGRDCRGETCDAGSVCSRDGCMPIAIAPEMLPPFESVPPHVNPCTLGSARFCDGFENTLDTWTSTHTDRGTIEASSLRAYSGAQSLRVTIDGPGASAFLYVQGLEYEIGDTIHARFYAWLPGGASFANFNILEFAGVAFQGRPETRVGYWVRPAEAGIGPVPDRSLRTETWHCIEVAILLDTLHGSASFSIDGEEWGADDDLGTASGAIDGMKLGVGWSNTEQGALEFFLDDIVVADDPIGCN
jgi:hypothetical protein